MRVGCVSYLNSVPLIHGLTAAASSATVRFDVPARLLPLLEHDEVDVALCPVIDLHRSARPLRVVPVGGIACAGPTLTVRLFSRVPWDRVRTLHADIDSHTSVALARVVFRERWGLTPEVVPLDTRGGDTSGETMLLIGDKVITAAPPEAEYPFTLDLGEAWDDLTGLPFVFATWLTPIETDLGNLPDIMARVREYNLEHIDALAAEYAPRHGWPVPLARRYLGDILRYRIGERELQAMQRFGELCERHGMIDQARPLVGARRFFGRVGPCG